jgi:cytochrome c oxidase assembly protein subunit 15
LSSITADAVPDRRFGTDRLVAVWLIATAALTFSMVVIGGVTRLTLSGLSITEWNPVMGVLPPLGDAAWQAAFSKYQQIPEYAQVHYGMSLDEFKGIFFWEYLHRLVGRVTGLVALGGPVGLLALRRISFNGSAPLFAVPVLVLMQGVLGWYMVESGLSVRTSVSQYRLTAHLALALTLYSYCIWQAANRLSPAVLRLDPVVARLLRWVTGAVLGLVAVTILAGGFTAGTKAGLVYNSFPLMDGKLIPDGYFTVQPWWLNPFENVTAIQFDHRVLATVTVASVLTLAGLALRFRLPNRARLPIFLMLAMVLVQASLGISTLLWAVPIPLAALHQAGAVLLLTTVLLSRHAVRAPD